MNQAANPWICPACGRGVAPGQITCDHGGMNPLLPFRPVQPSIPIPNPAPYSPTPVIPLGVPWSAIPWYGTCSNTAEMH